MTAIIDDQDGRTDLYYDARSNLVAMEGPSQVQTAFDYDANSNLTTIYHEVNLIFDGNGDLPIGGDVGLCIALRGRWRRFHDL